jgi:hypothetical protein
MKRLKKMHKKEKKVNKAIVGFNPVIQNFIR